MTWRALVPIKAVAARKTRLAPCLSPGQRARLSDAMLWHVLTVLQRVDGIAEIVVLAERPPVGWRGGWRGDRGRGLNAELAHAAHMLGGPLLVIHADLPALTCEDVAALLDAAHEDAAIAPDRHLRGTNAIALRDAANLAFSFGEESLHRHVAEFGGRAGIVQRPGLATDIDLPEDLDAALALLGLGVTQSTMACALRTVRQIA